MSEAVLVKYIGQRRDQSVQRLKYVERICIATSSRFIRRCVWRRIHMMIPLY